MRSPFRKIMPKGNLVTKRGRVKTLQEEKQKNFVGHKGKNTENQYPIFKSTTLLWHSRHDASNKINILSAAIFKWRHNRVGVNILQWASVSKILLQYQPYLDVFRTVSGIYSITALLKNQSKTTLPTTFYYINDKYQDQSAKVLTLPSILSLQDDPIDVSESLCLFHARFVLLLH